MPPSMVSSGTALSLISTVSLLKLTEEDLAKVPYLQCCVLEAIRMHPAGIITRRVVNEFTIKVRAINR